MTIRSKLKKALPKKLVYYYALVSAIRAYMHDIRIRAYDKVYNASDAEKLKRDLTVNYHIIEKGLTMPEPRPGFGKQVVVNLVDYIMRYDRMNLPKDAVMFMQSVSVIKEYVAYHKEIGYEPDQEVQAKTGLVTERFPDIDGQKQIRTSREDYLKHIGGAFGQFCRSRYSVRHYSDKEVPLPVLHECIEMAQRSPSFCNRQPNRVHIVKNTKTKENVLALQNGNRGFGHLADTLLVITSSVSATKDLHERHENHLNGGMFIMTLLNALHFHGLGACSLNWSVSKERDIHIRRLLNIPYDEVVLLVISCGYLPEKLSVAASPRISSETITQLHT